MAESTKGHLVFACGESLYGVAADMAAEVVTLPQLTRVPGAPVYLLGVFAHRGEVVPVIDLLKLVGSPGAPEGWRRAVLIRTPKGALALTATRVTGVSQLALGLSPLGSDGVRAHLLGPAKSPTGDVAVIDSLGLFEMLSRGG